jgi:hypothetical protein
VSGAPITSDLMSLPVLNTHVRSVAVADGAEFGLVRTAGGDRLAILAPKSSPRLNAFEGEDRGHRGGRTLLLCPLSARNAGALRTALPELAPKPLGLRTSVGFGDRLGLATPGHVRALWSVGGEVAPIFAQQSIRENARTGRTPQEVLDDATFGAFAEGWDRGAGADADHLKTFEDVDACVAAGYTLFTFDPGEYVDDRAEGAGPSVLRNLLDALPWDELEDRPGDLVNRYPERLNAEGHEITLGEEILSRAAVKYGRAVAHAAAMFRHLEGTVGSRPFEVEISVDETASPTTHAQHAYIARELARLGVRFVSLAPRYVGSFEKGVDYIGDVGRFERDFAVHAALARESLANMPYKLSLHSGSDKFSIYGAAVRQTQGLVHLKTAGTSYLEALRTVAALDPNLFRDLYAFCRESYEEDRASYHISASLEKAVPPQVVADEGLPGLLERFDEREILHVTFGSVLKEPTLRGRLFDLLQENLEEYADNLEKHFVQHLKPFVEGGEK